MGVPLLAYQILRASGASVYATLLLIAAAGAVPAAVQLIRRRRVGRIPLYLSIMSVSSLLVSLVPGSKGFLLAKGAVLTAGTAGWFLLSLRAPRPLTYVFTKPLLEGRLTWPGDWEGHWVRSSRFRRMWRTSTVMWAAGLGLDAVARVVMAFSLPADIVPGLGTGLYVATLVVLNIVVNAYYVGAGVFARNGRLYEADTPGADPGEC